MIYHSNKIEKLNYSQFYDLIFNNGNANLLYNRNIFTSRNDFLNFIDLIVDDINFILLNYRSESEIRDKTNAIISELIGKYIIENGDGNWKYIGRL